MNDLNTVTIIGRLTRDVDLKFTTGGMAIANGSLAVNRSVKTAEGYKEQASFIEFSIFGKTAENLAQYMTKGKQMAINGYLKQDSWKDPEGNNHSKLKVCANEIELLGGNISNSQEGYQAQNNGYDAGAAYGYDPNQTF